MGIAVDGLSVSGDPSGMRRMAAEFTARAETIAEVVDSLSQRVVSMTFEGPAATQLHAAMRDREERAHRAVLRLEAASTALRRAAGRLEDELEEERAALRRSSELDSEG